MAWIELLVPTTLDGVPRQPGWRDNLSQDAAAQLMYADAAREADGPYPSREGAGYDRSDLQLDEVSGVGQATAEEIYQYLDDKYLIRPQAILRHGPERIPEVSDELADKIASHLRDVDSDSDPDTDG